jgi:hypothetical protein
MHHQLVIFRASKVHSDATRYDYQAVPAPDALKFHKVRGPAAPYPPPFPSLFTVSECTMMMSGALIVFLTLMAFSERTTAQDGPGQPPSSWPQNYSGTPNESYSPAWQSCTF